MAAEAERLGGLFIAHWGNAHPLTGAGAHPKTSTARSGLAHD